MSTKVNHPDLHIEHTRYTPAQIQAYFNKQMLHDRYNGALDDLEGLHRSIRTIVFPLRCTRLTPRRYIENAPFLFENFPVNIQCRIWKQVIPNNQLIHCLSRLDSQNPPLDWNPEREEFPSRFHIGDGPCSIAKAGKPSRYTNHFRVSKRWFYLTIHLFYGKP